MLYVAAAFSVTKCWTKLRVYVPVIETSDGKDSGI